MVVYDGPNYYPACTLTAKLNESMIGKDKTPLNMLFLSITSNCNVKHCERCQGISKRGENTHTHTQVVAINRIHGGTFDIPW